MSAKVTSRRLILTYCATTVLCLSLVGVGLASAQPGNDHGGPVNPGKACGHSNSSTIVCTTTTTGTITTATGTITTATATGTITTATATVACHSTVTTTTGTTTTATTALTTTTTSTALTTTATATTGSMSWSVSGRATPSHPCGTIQVQAKVLHAARGGSFSASATAHFASGNVTIALRRAGKSFVALGKIPVPAAQPAGLVAVDISVVYGGSTTMVKTTSQIGVP